MSAWIDACPAVVEPRVLQSGLKVAELPAGLLTGTRALKMLNVPVHVRHAYDVLKCLQKQSMAGFSAEDRCHMHFGRPVGDILALRPEQLEIVHLIISGPCCPPWSTLGSQGYLKVRSLTLLI